MGVRRLLVSGLLNGALLGAALATTVVSPVAAALTSPQIAEASRLAETIVRTVMTVQVDAPDQSAEAQKVRIEMAVQKVIRDSGATPEVAKAAVDMAYKMLKDRGALVCVAPTRDVEENCNPPGLALASIGGLLQDVLDSQTTTIATPGPIPIGDPQTLGPTSGTSDYRGG